MESQENYSNEEEKEEVFEFEVKVKRNIPQGVKNKAYGNGIEREYALIFQAEGFPMCKTSRNGNKMLDSCKVDLTHIPVNLQIKAGFQQNMTPTSILKAMEAKLVENYPAYDIIHTLPKAVLHHKRKDEDQYRRSDYDAMVHMTFKDFLKLVKAYQKQMEHDIQSKQGGN